MGAGHVHAGKRFRVLVLDVFFSDIPNHRGDEFNLFLGGFDISLHLLAELAALARHASDLTALNPNALSRLRHRWEELESIAAQSFLSVCACKDLLEFAFSYSRCYLLCCLILIDQQGVMRAMRGCSAGTQDLA